MQLFLWRCTLLLILVPGLLIEGSFLGFGNKKKESNSPINLAERLFGSKNVPVNKKLSQDYINGMLSIQGRIIFNTVDQPSSLKLYSHVNLVPSNPDHPDPLAEPQ
ncbi:hypothetical protein KR018_004817 [Drosophila ironensis]|nr:hypothetical protein KR018_004817 [Drosophila ironensis]